MTILSLPNLPYALDALMPYMSPETLEFHYGKHHAAYVTKGNELLAQDPLPEQSIEDIIQNTPEGPLFNNVAQAWNHAFFWESMRPNGGGNKMPGNLERAIGDAFGSLEAMKEEFAQACMAQFGSGWGWLVWNPVIGRLEIVKTANADTPLRHKKIPLLTCDVWEHAYYIDYRNVRLKYVTAFLESLANWERADERLYRAQK